MKGKRRALWIGRRRLLVTALVLSGLGAAWVLGLHPALLEPTAGSWEVFRRFLAAAATPAFDYERPSPLVVTPFLLRVADALWATVRYAATAVSLAAVVGFFLGYAGTRFRRGGRVGVAGISRAVNAAVYVGARAILVGLRSVHELIWAVLFLAAVGYTPLVAVLAIAIPYAGTFGKIFSELFEEHAGASGEALEAAGAGPWQAFLFGTLPRAWPDCLSYILYRFECGLRSSAVLGFMGVLTVGYYLRLSTEEGHFREVWTYLYALLALILFFDAWSNLVRKKLRVRSNR